VDEEVQQYLNIGKIFDQPVCEKCDAFRWPSESKTLCCNNGKILESTQPYKRPPAPLCELLENKRFCEKIKEYNHRRRAQISKFLENSIRL
jgi:hypothetical protein